MTNRIYSYDLNRYFKIEPCGQIALIWSLSNQWFSDEVGFFIGDRPIGCMGFSSALRHIKCRDQFIGWSKQQRTSHLHLIAYNTRFLILPWVSIYCLASQWLSKIANIVSDDWMPYYNHPVYYLETFVDTERFWGSCYKASNWIYLGNTTGRGKNDHTHQQNRSLKAVWGYPLVNNFRELLQQWVPG